MKKNQSFEILLLGVLAIILFGYLSAVYLIRPINEKADDLSGKAAALEAEISSSYYTLAAYDAKGNRLKAMKRELIKSTDIFYGVQNETAYLGHINDNIENCDITFISLTAAENPFRVSDHASDNAARQIYAELTEDKRINTSSILKSDKFDSFFEKLQAKEGRFETDVSYTGIKLEAEGTYENILKLIQSLLKTGKSIVINSMSLDIPENISLSADANPNVRLEITLSYVSIPNISEYYEIKEPKKLPEFRFPMDVISGTYRSSDSFLSYLSNLLS